MQTLGGSCGFSGAVTEDEYFYKSMEQTAETKLISTYIYVANGGDIVWENSNGNIEWFPNAGAGYHPLAAARILSNGVETSTGQSRTTTAENMNYLASNKIS